MNTYDNGFLTQEESTELKRSIEIANNIRGEYEKLLNDLYHEILKNGFYVYIDGAECEDSCLEVRLE